MHATCHPSLQQDVQRAPAAWDHPPLPQPPSPTERASKTPTSASAPPKGSRTPPRTHTHQSSVLSASCTLLLILPTVTAAAAQPRAWHSTLLRAQTMVKSDSYCCSSCRVRMSGGSTRKMSGPGWQRQNTDPSFFFRGKTLQERGKCCPSLDKHWK